jgi:hypothetical protein
VVARELYAAWRQRGPAVLPRPPLPPSEPGHAAPLLTDAPAGAVTDARELGALATDAVHRAWALATGRGDGDLGLAFEDDLARRAHTALGTPRLRVLAEASGRSERQLVHLASAWGNGGVDALAVLDDGWTPAAATVEEARTALLAEVVRVRRSGPHLSLPGGVQLRLSPAGRWYPCQRRGGDWEVIGPGDTDPVAAYDTRT